MQLSASVNGRLSFYVPCNKLVLGVVNLRQLGGSNLATSCVGEAVIEIIGINANEFNSIGVQSCHKYIIFLKSQYLHFNEKRFYQLLNDLKINRLTKFQKISSLQVICCFWVARKRKAE